MMEERGTLPVGIEYDGGVHTEYILREQIVGDAVAIFESGYSARAMENDAYYGVCMMACRVSITGLPDGKLTPDMLMQANQLDFDELHNASKRLDKRRLDFRSQGKADEANASGDAAAGV